MPSHVYAVIGGAGYGKSTRLHTVMATLKKSGHSVEFVPEFAKIPVLQHNRALTDTEQRDNFNALLHWTHTFQQAGINIILQESCPLICMLYMQLEQQHLLHSELTPLFTGYTQKTSTHYLLIEPYPGHHHTRQGRYHNPEQAAAVHRFMHAYLRETYTEGTDYTVIPTHPPNGLTQDDLIRNLILSRPRK